MLAQLALPYPPGPPCVDRPAAAVLTGGGHKELEDGSRVSTSAAAPRTVLPKIRAEGGNGGWTNVRRGDMYGEVTTEGKKISGRKSRSENAAVGMSGGANFGRVKHPDTLLKSEAVHGSRTV